MQWEQNLCLLPETDSQMFTPTLDTSADLAIDLLIHYSFDLSGYSADELVDRWQQEYSGSWLHLAVIEALYQGRYKAVSVQQILKLWQRRGQAIFHFNMEFERLICSKFPQSLTSPPAPDPSPVKNTTKQKLSNEDTRTQEQGDTETHKHGDKEKEDRGMSGHRVSPTNTLTPVVRPSLQSPEPDNSFLLKSGKPTPVAYRDPGFAKHWLSTALSSSTKESRQGELPTPVRQESLQRSHYSQVSSSKKYKMPKQVAKLFPVATTHPPIGQFTPEKSHRSDSFTSKLKAIAQEETKDENSENS